MKKKKIVKIILILIIAFFILNLVPYSINYVSGFQSNINNSKFHFLSIHQFSDAIFFVKQNQKLSGVEVELKSTELVQYNTNIQDIYSSKSSGQNSNFDYRKNIRQSIPHYFNGGAYKSLWNNHKVNYYRLSADNNWLQKNINKQ